MSAKEQTPTDELPFVSEQWLRCLGLSARHANAVFRSHKAQLTRQTATHEGLVRALEGAIDPLQIALDRAEWREANLPERVTEFSLSTALRFALQTARAALAKEGK